MSSDAIRQGVARHIGEHGLLSPGGEVVALVSGGPDSTCLWHVLGALGYAVSAVHVSHGLRGEESDADAEHCVRELGAAVVECKVESPTEARLREARYAVTVGSCRATGHTASDQVETILQRLVSSGTTRGIRVKRDDGVVRPLLGLWREDTLAYCAAEGLAYRMDSSNDATKRGLLRREVLPFLRELHPAADENILRAAEPQDRLPRKVERGINELLRSRSGSSRIDLGSGVTAVREYEKVWLERSPARLEVEVEVQWSGWRLVARVPGLLVRGWRPGDRLGGDGAKVQDLFVDAKVPPSEREARPLVAHGRHIVVIPGIACAPGYEHAVVAERA